MSTCKECDRCLAKIAALAMELAAWKGAVDKVDNSCSLRMIRAVCNNIRRVAEDRIAEARAEMERP